MLVLLLIVQPKINRVWSGDKVVVSNVLRESSSFPTRSTAGTAGSSRPPDYSAGLNLSRQQTTVSNASSVELPPPQPSPSERVITLQQDEPLPRKLELCMYNMLEILRAETRRSSEGHPLKLSSWEALCQETTELSSWTERIELS